jgi:ribosomal protein S28E/S33
MRLVFFEHLQVNVQNLARVGQLFNANLPVGESVLHLCGRLGAIGHGNDHRVRLALARGRDRGRMLAAQVPVSDRLSEPVSLQDPILDAALDPLGPIL